MTALSLPFILGGVVMNRRHGGYRSLCSTISQLYALGSLSTTPKYN